METEFNLHKGHDTLRRNRTMTNSKSKDVNNQKHNTWSPDPGP